MCTQLWWHPAVEAQTQTSILLTPIFNILQNWWNTQKLGAQFSAATASAVNGALLGFHLAPHKLSCNHIIKGPALGNLWSDSLSLLSEQLVRMCTYKHFSFFVFFSRECFRYPSVSHSLSYRPSPGSYRVLKCTGNNWPSLSSQDYENKSPFGGEQCQQSLKSCYMGYYPPTNCFFPKAKLLSLSC